MALLISWWGIRVTETLSSPTTVDGSRVGAGKKKQTGSGGSPSVQVKEVDIQAGHDEGVHHLTKAANFGQADIITMSPAMMPAYLLNHSAVMRGTMTAHEAQAATPQPAAATVVDYCWSRGFYFDPDFVARYIAALVTKPFVISAGISGTGKSKLAELVAEFYSATPASAPAGAGTLETGDSFVFVPAKGPPDATRFALVAVRPDWIDNQSILGFVNPITRTTNRRRRSTLSFVRGRPSTRPPTKRRPRAYFMLFDEMNLARVEHYFSDWLACAESRRLDTGRLDHATGGAAPPLGQADGDDAGENGRLERKGAGPAFAGARPTNLVVTGTVNVDETTYGFSPKVLDRAMVLSSTKSILIGCGPPAKRLTPADTAFRMNCHRFGWPPSGLRGSAGSALTRIGSDERASSRKPGCILGTARPTRLGFLWRSTMISFLKIQAITTGSALLTRPFFRRFCRASLETGRSWKVRWRRLCAYFRDLASPVPMSAIKSSTTQSPRRLPKSYRRAVEMLEALRDFGFMSFFK